MSIGVNKVFLRSLSNELRGLRFKFLTYVALALFIFIYFYPLLITPKGLIPYVIPPTTSLIVFSILYGVVATFKPYEERALNLVILFFVIKILTDLALGVVKGFGLNILTLTSYVGIAMNLMRELPTVLGFEVVRAYLLSKARGGKSVVAFLSISAAFALMNEPITRYVNMLNSSYNEVVNFMFKNYVPALAQNMLLGILYVSGGFNANALYALLDKLYIYTTPLLPNISLGVRSVIAVIQAFVFFSIVEATLKEQDVFSKYSFKLSKNFLSYLIPALIFLLVGALLLSSARLFVVSSGSMVPTLNVGDVVLVVKSNEVGVGDIIAFYVGSEVVIHRVYDVVVDSNGSTYFTTKGDNNDHVDPFKVEPPYVVGKLALVIPYVGIIWIYVMKFFIEYLNLLSFVFFSLILTQSLSFSRWLYGE